MCKVSVITPVYKVEKYLGKCIDNSRGHDGRMRSNRC